MVGPGCILFFKREEVTAEGWLKRMQKNLPCIICSIPLNHHLAGDVSVSLKLKKRWPHQSRSDCRGLILIKSDVNLNLCLLEMRSHLFNRTIIYCPGRKLSLNGDSLVACPSWFRWRHIKELVTMERANRKSQPSAGYEPITSRSSGVCSSRNAICLKPLSYFFTHTFLEFLFNSGTSATCTRR